MAQILIGIQARSSSSRLPGKSLEIIENQTMVDWVISAAKSSAFFLNKTSHRTDMHVTIALLVPEGDELKEKVSECLIVEGPEDDVLTRYAIAVKHWYPDYIVRITGDCPLLIPAIITKAVKACVENELDYVSNGWEGLRTYIDGLDVEVISSKAFNWLNNSASDKKDREHVTTYLRRNPPPWLKVGHIISHIDLEDIKLSVDTSEELERVRKNKKSIATKLKIAKDWGHHVFRF